MKPGNPAAMKAPRIHTVIATHFPPNQPELLGEMADSSSGREMRRRAWVGSSYHVKQEEKLRVWPGSLAERAHLEHR